MNRKTKLLLLTLVALMAVWAFVLGGFKLARDRRVTGEKVQAFMESHDLSKTFGVDRAKLLRELADYVNRLPYEDRRNLRLQGKWDAWFGAMTPEEQNQFLEATMPTGFKQALTAFEQLPEEKRRKTVDDAFKQLRSAEKAAASGQGRPPGAPAGGTNRPPLISEEQRQRVATIGLNTFLKEASPQARAELMPLLEEMQRSMQRGRVR